MMYVRPPICNRGQNICIPHPVKQFSILEDNNQSNNNTSLLPTPPSQHPNYNSHPDTSRASRSPEPVTLPATALIGISHGILVAGRVNEAPDRGADSRDHGHDAPVRAEVLDSPDGGDEDGDEREGASVAEAN